MHSGMTRVQLVIIAVSLAMVIILVMPLFRDLKESSLQAEAKVMLTYLATLENAYVTDKGSYAYFESYYGASLFGIDYCDRPEGAEELGFMLRGCHPDMKTSRVRYAYRSTKADDPNKGFIGEAISGSDREGHSFICYAKNKHDQWLIDKSKISIHNKDCD